MPVFAELGSAVSRLNVMIIQTNEVLTDSFQKYIPQTEKEEEEGKERVVNPCHYPVLMHGPAKHCRFILSGNVPYLAADSAQKAAELLLKYILLLEPQPTQPREEQPLLFLPEALPHAKAA